MKVRVEVESTEIVTKSGTNARGPWTIREQDAYAFIGDTKYPQQITVTLDDGKPAYPIGQYELDEKSLYVGKYSQLQIRPRLRAVVAPAGTSSAQRTA